MSTKTGTSSAEISNFDHDVLEARERRVRTLLDTLYEHLEVWCKDNNVKAAEMVAVLHSSSIRILLAAGATDAEAEEKSYKLTRGAINDYRKAERREAEADINTLTPKACDAGAN